MLTTGLVEKHKHLFEEFMCYLIFFAGKQIRRAFCFTPGAATGNCMSIAKIEMDGAVRRHAQGS